MKKFSDEVELKKELDNYGVRFGDRINDYTFYVEFFDNKGATVISRGLYSSPLGAVRDLGRLIPELKLPADDISMYLLYALPYDTSSDKMPIKFNDIELDKYLYFKQPEKVDISNKE